MTPEGSAGLVVDAQVRRGGFTLAASLTAPPGQVLGLLGPNGAGKSTLLSAVAGLTPVSAGRITLAGQVLDDAGTGAFTEASGRPVGFVFQNYRLFPHLTVAENVAFSPRARGLGRQAARSAARHWLDRLRLTDLADRKPDQLSGGQAQRVALARALAGQPALLLLDEPLSALDAGTRLDVQAELKRHLADFAGPCLLVTHDPLEALVLADQLVVLEGGRIVQEGTPAHIARQPGTDYIAKLVGLNLYAGRADGSAVALRGGGTFVVPDQGSRGDVLVAVRPSAVIVSTQHPEPSSARNTWPAKVTGLSLLADRVRLDLEGQPSALADITPAAVADLSLAPGSQVWLTVKATDLEVYPHAGKVPGTPSRLSCATPRPCCLILVMTTGSGGGLVRVYQQHIDGKWVSSGSLFDDLDPYRGTVMARVPAGTRADAARAVDAAAAAFPGWAELPPADKQAMFLRAADIVERRQEEITALLATETGCAGAFAGFQVLTATRLLRQAANWGYLPVGEVIRSDLPGTFALALRKPLGVVAGISPWNGAHVLAWRTVVNPVAFGNTVVLKPSEEAPVSAGLLVAEIMAEAGFPPGVVNVVTHAPGGAAPVADEFFDRPEVRCINFTGSSATGRLLAERAGRHLKRCVLELGGYNPLIVLADADLEYAVEAAAFAAFFHSGQICMNARKVLIERPVYDTFIDRLVVRAGSLPLGDPAAAGTVIGPLITPAARDRVAREVQEAVDAGARILAGGSADGPCYRPTILADVPAGARIHSEETFGPVLVAQAVDDAEEAVGIANSTRYGLSAGLITRDSQRGFALARRIDAGVVHVNDQTIADEPQLPLGGVKDSGWGRSGPQSMADFTEVQWITTRDGAGHYPI